MELNERHKAFVQVYTSNGFNATKAYMKVYPDSSYEAAQSSASDLLLNPKVKEEIERVRNDFQTKIHISKEDILEKLYEIMLANQGKKDTFTLKSIEIINKMLGYNEPEIINNNNNNILPTEIKINIIKPKGDE
jgi:phage terminase small subunit